jgi:protein phosphatase
VAAVAGLARQRHRGPLGLAGPRLEHDVHAPALGRPDAQVDAAARVPRHALGADGQAAPGGKDRRAGSGGRSGLGGRGVHDGRATGQNRYQPLGAPAPGTRWPAPRISRGRCRPPTLPPTPTPSRPAAPALDLPAPGLVLLVGPSGSGKSTFAARHFAPTEVVSSDRCRAWVADDENDQSATADAFTVLHQLVGTRLARGRLTVVDATNVQPAARAPLLALARRCALPATAVVFDLPEAVLAERRTTRTDRRVPEEAVHRQREQLHRALEALPREGFAAVHVLRDAGAVAVADVRRVPLAPDLRREHGPFDVVGDVHGCFDELCTLLERLGYVADATAPTGAWDAGFVERMPPWRHPAGRRVVFVGDLVDRGPRIADTLRLAMAMRAAGSAFAVVGNHDDKLLRLLRGHAVHVAHGLERTLAELDAASDAFRDAVREFLGTLPTHVVLDDGALVIAHAGLPESLHGREGRRVRDHALFGETTGTPGPDGLPQRIDWGARYRGRALVVYGHTPVTAPRWQGRTVDIDTGCVFGGALTALRWPEEALVGEPARRQYAVPGRPIRPDPFVAPGAARSVDASRAAPGDRRASVGERRSS